MPTSPRMKAGVSLEEFLRMRGIEEAPGLEYIDRRIESKAFATPRHGLIAMGFCSRLDQFSEPEGMGLVMRRIRNTFAGRSVLPDVSFHLAENILVDPDGTVSGFLPVPPDIHMEIICPEQSVPKTVAKIVHTIGEGCKLGILVHPLEKTIDVYRPDRPPERLSDDCSIDFAPVLPGLVISVAEVFGWMVVRLRKPGAEPA